MPPMPQVATMRELYPPKDERSTSTLVKSLLTGRRDWSQKGRCLIKREATPDERRALQDRTRALIPWIQAGDKARKKQALMAMMLGFGGNNSTREEMTVVVAAYLGVLLDVPDWAVVRACTRFSTHQVTAEELGETRLDYGFKPSAAQIHKVATALAQPVREEHAQLCFVLDGVVDHQESVQDSETRERMVRKFGELLQGLRKHTKEQEEQKRENLRQNRAKSDQDHYRSRWLLKDYRDAGVTPPAEKDGTIPSLSLMLNLGWRIREMPNGEKVLIKPLRATSAAPKPQEPRAEEIPF